jgi:Zn-dependent M28 family amino/carboxypeptidase
MAKLRLAILMLLCATSLLLAQDQAAPAQVAPAAKPAIRAALPPSAAAAMDKINPERIRATVKFLADDLLEGRGTGARGGDIAALYLATEFETMGLKPAGDNGTYFQKVPMVGVTTEPGTTMEFVPAGGGAPIALRYLDDFVVNNQTAQPVSDIDAPVVFVGFGIEAPEYRWNDFKNADVRGKVLLMFVNEPPSDDVKFFKGKALTYYGRWTYKYEEAARKGAVGVVLIHRTDLASYGWNVVRTSWSGENSQLADDRNPKLEAASWVQLAVAEQLAGSIGKNVDQLYQMAQSRDFQPVPLPMRLIAHVVSRARPFSSSNVLAELPGTDRAAQAILYTAHYDHLGIHPDEPPPNIYHGAADNATGCGILLEIARAFARVTPRPRRTILFASVTGEEQGLLGSEYLGQHPPIPAKNISLDLNFDDVQPLGVPEEVEVSGAERTTFYPVVESMARQFAMAIKPDSNPGAGYYYRSDHFSLARVGIPAFSVNQGLKFQGHTREWGEEQQKEFTAKHYHQPSDEYRPDMDFRGDARIAQFGFALGWTAASQPQEVQWLPGDEFEAARKASQH